MQHVTLVQRGHFDSVLGHSQDHLLVSRNKRQLSILLSGVDVIDEVQRLLEGSAHVKLELLDGSHILDPELSTRV